MFENVCAGNYYVPLVLTFKIFWENSRFVIWFGNFSFEAGSVCFQSHIGKTGIHLSQNGHYWTADHVTTTSEIFKPVAFGL